MENLTYPDIIRELIRRGKFTQKKGEERLAEMAEIPVEKARSMLNDEKRSAEWAHTNWEWDVYPRDVWGSELKREWSKMTELAREVDRVMMGLNVYISVDPIKKDVKEDTAYALKRALPLRLYKQDLKLWENLHPVAQDTIIYRTLGRYFN
tara:strand:+ start:561 stop:1013 length:453 start_codon:yes stop_codon:yes gene_type:complete